MIFKQLADKYWRYHDELKALEIVCQSQEGKAIYRRGQLMWKTKAMIVEDNMITLRNVTPITADVIPAWTDSEKRKLREVLSKIFGIENEDA